MLRAFVKGLTLIVSSDCHNNTNAKVERANGVISDTLRAFANARQDDWERQRPLAVLAIRVSNLSRWWRGCSTAKTTKRGVARYLVRRRGHASADDAWLLVEELGHCLE